MTRTNPKDLPSQDQYERQHYWDTALDGSRIRVQRHHLDDMQHVIAATPFAKLVDAKEMDRQRRDRRRAMTRTSKRTDDDFDNGVLRDGRSARFQMTAMDSVQKKALDIINKTVKVTDADVLARHRPGFRVADTDAGKQRRAVYDRYDAAKANEYRDDNGDLQEGDSCTCRGSSDFGADGDAGTMQYVDDVLVCVSNDYDDSNTNNQASDAKQRAYDSYDRSLANAYKK